MAKKILNKEMQSRLVWHDFARFTPEEGKQYILLIRLLRTNTCMYFIDRACRYHLDNEEFKNIKGFTLSVHWEVLKIAELIDAHTYNFK